MKYVVTRKPYNRLSSLNDFDRIFSNFWSDFPSVSPVKNPRVDIRENENGYLLEAELPGLSEKDVEVNVEKHVLTISSVKSTEEKKEEVQSEFLVRERSTYEFRRSFVLPEGVAEDKIKGEFKHGVLSLNIPKLPEKQPKRIAVKLAS